jgi:ATP-dependent Lon protease
MSKPLPIIAMRGGVLFPGMSLPISAARPGTLRAIEAALREPEHQVFVVAQRSEAEEIEADNLYSVGVIATVSSLQRGLGGARLVLEGRRRAVATRVASQDGYLAATVAPAVEHPPLDPGPRRRAGPEARPAR